MKGLTVIEKEGKLLTDSREVAEMVGKEHAHLMRDIRTYEEVISQNPKLDSQDFFIQSTYQGQRRLEKCYLLTKQGCEMVANKMTGEKGILFTATYVQAFNNMEDNIKKCYENINSRVSSYKELSPEDKIIKLLNVLPESERGKYMIELMKIYFNNDNDNINKPSISVDKGLTIEKVKDVLKQAYDKAYVATRNGYVIMLKEVVHKYLASNGIRKHEFNKFLKENNIAKVNSDGYVWNQFRVDGKKNSWEYFISIELFK